MSTGTSTSAPPTTRHGRAFELVAIVVTAAGKFLLGDLLDLGLYYISVACIFWIGYVSLRARHSRTVLARWGFTRHGLAAALRMLAPIAVVTLGGFVAYGLFAGTANLNWRTPVMLLAYPLWGIIQQFMVVALLADNVYALAGERMPRWSAILMAAVLFALVHMPVYPLVVATFFLGLITTTVFFRTRNLWLPGVYHGWYATVFYVFVMGEDPLGYLLSAAFG